MDDEQRKYFAELMATMEGVASDARAAASTSRETAATVRKLDSRVGILERHVFGSEPPPDQGDPVVRTLTDHDNNIATLTGQIIATRAELKDVKAQNEEQLELLRKVSKAVGGVLGNPTIRRIAWGVGVALTSWMATKGWLH